MTGLELHPVLPLLAGAATMPLLAARARGTVSVLAALLSLLLLAGLPGGTTQSLALLGQTLTPLHVDALGRVFALAFTAYAALAAIYAWTDHGAAPRAFSLTLAAGGVGVTLAGDWLVFFLFWELLTVSSLFLVWQGRADHGRDALDAGFRYLVLHLGGGAALLVGILLNWNATGSLEIGALDLSGAAGWLVLGGMLVNAAMPPLHAWLPDAYPRATVFGTVFLCAFTTKSAVYALARAFPGADPLVWIGAGMTLYGVTFAVLENDMRRLLSYHIVSQVGYMVCGVGLGSALALNGSSAHAFAHIFYKGLLMMSAGALAHAAGTGRLSTLAGMGGLARRLKWVAALMLVGAFSIAGVPLFNGFTSKALVISAAAYENRPAIELVLLFASMGTFLSLGLKMPWLAFFAAPKDAPATTLRPLPRSMYVAMSVAAAVCVLTGVFPGLVYGLLPHAMHYAPYTADHVVGSLQLLAGTALGFWLLRGLLRPSDVRTLDVDNLYLRPVRRVVDGAGALFEGAGSLVASGVRALLARADAARRRRGPRTLIVAVQTALVLVVLVLLAFLVLD